MDTYEKKYKEAIKRAKAVLEIAANKEEAEGYVSTIFPELKESEDEKIRKEIINYLVEHDVDGYLLHADCEKWVAWLEKQGKLSIKWNKNTEGNKPQVNHSVLMKTFQGIAEGEWKGEYWEQYRWAGIVRDSDVLSWMELSDLDKQGEQEPAWNEKDEKEYKYVLKFVGNILNNCDNDKDYDHSKRCYDWLKSLKQRIGGKL